jgi:hypothetical protein
MTASRARQMWELAERLHASFYLAPEPRETAAEAGLKGFWMTYFASRAAPMGAVRPEVVTSTFFYFAPRRVERAIPDAWALCPPERVLEARYRGVDRVLRRLYGDAVGDPRFAAAAALTRRALEGGSTLGRPLFASWAALPWPDEPHLALWHGCTLLREHRSGAHVVALATAGLDGCESVVSHVAADQAPHEWIEGEAGWTADEAAAARDRLAARGWLDDAGAITAAGAAGRAEVEALTDRLDDGPWVRLGEDARAELVGLLEGLVAVLPPDDQLDWREVYGPNPAAGDPGGLPAH